MINLLAIFIGGGIGSIIRYLVGLLCTHHLSYNLPLATFIVNILGSFIIGLAISFFLHKTGIPQAYKLAITVGFCGGLSTFSSFSIEVLNMLKDGDYLRSFIYVILSIIICFAAAFIGLKTGNKLF